MKKYLLVLAVPLFLMGCSFSVQIGDGSSKAFCEVIQEERIALLELEPVMDDEVAKRVNDLDSLIEGLCDK